MVYRSTPVSSPALSLLFFFFAEKKKSQTGVITCTRARHSSSHLFAWQGSQSSCVFSACTRLYLRTLSLFTTNPKHPLFIPSWSRNAYTKLWTLNTRRCCCKRPQRTSQKPPPRLISLLVMWSIAVAPISSKAPPATRWTIPPKRSTTPVLSHTREAATCREIFSHHRMQTEP